MGIEQIITVGKGCDKIGMVKGLWGKRLKNGKWMSWNRK
jgi:hypothetical protein